MYNLQIIEERIMSLAEKQNLSKNKLLLNVHLHKGVFDNMKKGQIPSVDKLHIIADYLNCSVDYLLGRTDNPEINRSIQSRPTLADYGKIAAEGGKSTKFTVDNDDTNPMPFKKS